MRVKEGNKEKDILDASVKVFAQKGYHTAKITDIAKEAGVAAGSVYLYYENKEDLLLKIFEQLWRTLYKGLKEVSDIQSISPVEKIESMVDLLFDIFAQNPSLAIVFVNEQNRLLLTTDGAFIKFHDDFLELGENFLKEGIEQKYFSPDIDIKVFRHFIVGAIRNLLNEWALDSENVPLNKIRQNVKFFVKHGIRK